MTVYVKVRKVCFHDDLLGIRKKLRQPAILFCYRSFNPGKKDEFGVKINCLRLLVSVYEPVSQRPINECYRPGGMGSCRSAAWRIRVGMRFCIVPVSGQDFGVTIKLSR